MIIIIIIIITTTTLSSSLYHVYGIHIITTTTLSSSLYHVYGIKLLKHVRLLERKGAIILWVSIVSLYLCDILTPAASINTLVNWSITDSLLCRYVPCAKCDLFKQSFHYRAPGTPYLVVLEKHELSTILRSYMYMYQNILNVMCCYAHTSLYFAVYFY